ncbi:hypothetical protein DL96DRAFT_1703078 [Flagelloscypha sp. PMI_526]|nr:hypothetical protein DL96DRAFT_1703078 [Flagelloscypha sp. PMI_526]
MGAFDLTVGTRFLAWFLGQFSVFLYAFVLNQYLTYKTTKFEDPIWLRVLVAILFIVDTSQTAVQFYTVWYFLVKNYANPSVLNYVFWMLPFCGATTAISALIVQTFLINRLYRLTRQIWLCITLVLAAVTACVCGTIASAWCGIIFDAKKLAPVIPLVIVWLVTVACVDIVITVTLSRSLWRCKTGCPGTNTVVNRCIKASIQSGLFSSVIAIANLASFVFWNNTHVNLIFAWPKGRVYSNSLLYTLVARKELAEIVNRTVEFEDSRFSFSSSPHINAVRIQRETATDAIRNEDAVGASLDQNIVVPPTKVLVCPQPTPSCAK